MPFAGGRRFKSCIMIESAQRFRDRLEKLGRDQTLYFSLSAMFVVTFGTAMLLRPEMTLGALPTWQNIAALVAVSLGAAYGCFRMTRIILERRQVAYVRDANIAVGHSLLKLTANQMRVFHEVPCKAGFVDNVVVGLHGIYAVNVVTRRPGKKNVVRLRDDKLIFAPDGDVVSVSDCGAKAQQLASMLKQQVGYAVRVRPVVAVPGWEIESQESAHYLAVNERNVAMLRGWKDEKDYLMNEDVDKIQAFLTAKSTRR
jgi:hypothetical protein